MMPRLRTVLVTATLGLVVLSCREGVAPFTPDELDHSDAALMRLTFNAGDERDPQWSAGGDTVYFHSDQWHALPGYRGTLLQVPADGGTATPLSPAVQPSAAPKLLLPVPTRAGERIAYLHLRRERPPVACTAGEFPCPIPAPLLDTAALRVRRIDAQTSTFTDPSVTVPYPGPTPSIEPPFIDSVFPYQIDYSEGNEVVNLRPSWSPDGERIVYSDGTRLLIWEPGDAAGIEIPNTTDGVAPAWSPDGQWIAFGILERGAPLEAICACTANDPPILVTRHAWEPAERLLAVVRPDGSDLRIITEGAEPAWTPDGSTLYFRRGQTGLYRIPAAGGTPEAIAETSGARAPAISPDGSAVAFARRDAPRDDFNIWRLRLEP
jgi:Tol biopolymer transport system component